MALANRKKLAKKIKKKVSPRAKKVADKLKVPPMTAVKPKLDKKKPTQECYAPAQYTPKHDAWEGWTKRILIAVPTTGNIRIEWMMTRGAQVIPCNWSNGDIFQFYDQFSPIGWAVADTRNVCLEHFMKEGFEWLFFIDHDTLLPPDTFLKINEYMINGDYPVVSGLYYCKGSHPEPLIYRGRGNGYFNKWKIGDKVMVDGIPMGCCLIHRSLIEVLYHTSEQYVVGTMNGPVPVRKVFETPRKAWFDPELQSYQTQTGTEDLFWCDRIMKEKVFERCGVAKYKKFQKMKYPFLLDTSMFCRHIDGKGVQYPSWNPPRRKAGEEKFIK